MLAQYFRAKETHPEALLAMRVGDFYEFYGEDAEKASAALEITLTGREDGSNGRVPMAGVPFHSVEKYLSRLVSAGFKVALCDQVEDPKKAKGLVRREVTRVLTAGTLLEDSMLASGANNFLAALCVVDGKAGLASLDPSTGEFMVTQIDGPNVLDCIVQELARIMPAELVCAQDDGGYASAAKPLGIPVTERSQPDQHKATRILQNQFSVSNLGGFGLGDKPGAVAAASMVLDYVGSNGVGLAHIDTVRAYSVDGHMRMDPSTRRSLELTTNLRDGGRQNTLLEVLDRTVTPMGARLLKRWIEQPLLDLGLVGNRQRAVQRLAGNILVRGDLRDALKKVSDIERIVSRCASSVATPRDLAGLRQSLLRLPDVDDALRKVALEHLQAVRGDLDLHEDLAAHMETAIVPDPPASAREGGIFRDGFDMELDKLRDLSKNGKSYIAKLEAQEREFTGIDKLKVGYNSVFGYYLEVSRANMDRVPDRFVRKQTLANAERYITAELKDHESAVLGAEERALELESELFDRLRNKIVSHGPALIRTAKAVAELDVLAGLAEVALERRYTMPEIVEEDVLEIEEGRHPVVDDQVGRFVPNGLDLDLETRLIVLTGPNMSGKSTYLRQAALIVVMAQIGSFVPASRCRVGLCDQVFARIGAKDEIALGQSTFMVEMLESANILNNATPSSLVILDEVGRGTSTYDGLAIAWAMVEHLAAIGPKSLFATHYHQMNAIAEQIPAVANFRVSCDESGDQVVWTHKVLPGGTDKSYGLQVAKMAGVPGTVVRRAQEILASLEGTETSPVAVPSSLANVQLTLFEAQPHAVVQELAKIDVDSLTPIEALLKLAALKQNI